ncbi:hypothetical protein REPUB_Repub02eG0256000 [Reevesia pubescens]
MYSLWNNTESMLELKTSHSWYNYELDSIREELLGEIGMHQETANVLYQLLYEACQERDEAREQLKRSMAEISELKKLLNKLLPSNSAETSSAISHIQPDNPKQEILKGNLDMKDTASDDSSATNSMSRTLFTASLTDSSNLALLKKSFVQDSGSRIQMGRFSSKDLEDNPGSKLIDALVKGKPLPEKGRLLEAVLDTPPLLETLMITGQLPKWRNPPPLPSNIIGNDDHSLINQNQRVVINSKSAIPSSQILNYKKCSTSNSINFESLEHADKQNRFQ